MGDKNDHFDIHLAYEQELKNHTPPLPPHLAAVSALTQATDKHPLRTISETLTLLSTLSDELKTRVTPSEPVAAGTELFQRELLAKSNDVSKLGSTSSGRLESKADAPAADFETTKAGVIRAGHRFVGNGLVARKRIAGYGSRFLHDGSTVVVLACSAMVDQFLRNAASSQLDFQVVFVSSGSQNAKDTARYNALLETLRTAEVPATTTPLGALAAYLDDRHTSMTSLPKRDTINFPMNDTMFLTEASALYSNGDILAPLGTFTAASVAKTLNMPFWVLSETTKILSSFPSRRGPTSGDDRVPSAVDVPTINGNQAMDITPASLITGVITEEGPLSPSGISEEAIKIWF